MRSEDTQLRKGCQPLTAKNINQRIRIRKQRVSHMKSTLYLSAIFSGTPIVFVWGDAWSGCPLFPDTGELRSRFRGLAGLVYAGQTA
jgi:hypothetical protein